MKWQTISDIGSTMDRPGCYALILNGQVQYIGQSNNVRRRIKEHRWTTENATIKVRYSCRKGEHLAIESRLIHRLRPPLNATGHPDAHLLRSMRRSPMTFDQRAAELRERMAKENQQGGICEIFNPEKLYSLEEVAATWKLPLWRIRPLFAGRFVQALPESAIRDVFRGLTSADRRYPWEGTTR